MKRNPRKVKWTKAYRRLHGKDMTQDSTFEFERKRNRPERYDRKKIDKIRVAREARHHAMRMKGKKAIEKQAAISELEKGIDLVEAPAALLQESQFAPKIKSQGSGSGSIFTTVEVALGKRWHDVQEAEQYESQMMRGVPIMIRLAGTIHSCLLSGWNTTLHQASTAIPATMITTNQALATAGIGFPVSVSVAAPAAFASLMPILHLPK